MGREKKRKWVSRDKGNRWTKMLLLRASGGICKICGSAIEKMNDASVDHIVAFSKGGKDTPSNMQICHSWCNQNKGDQ